jgi:hypothetical protein
MVPTKLLAGVIEWRAKQANRFMEVRLVRVQDG